MQWMCRRKELVVLGVLSLRLSSAAAAAAPVQVDLTTFRSGAGARFYGSAYSSTGYSVSVVGDHNGDGYQDFIYGSASLDRAVIVMKKNTTYVPLSLSETVSGQYFRVLKGPPYQFGHTLGGVGDINADGFDDVIVCALYGEVAGRGYVGTSYVIFGTTGPFMDLTVTANWAASSLGFMILGTYVSTSFISAPRTACGLGDVNGDGIDDFAVTTDNSYSGAVYVIFGKNGTAFTTIDLLPSNFGSNGIYYVGMDSMALGFNVMPAGDFNGDGIADFLLSAHEFDPVVDGVMRSNAGAAYLIHGSKTTLTTLHMSNFTTGSMGVRFLGGASQNKLGVSLAGVGDINDDGIDDIAIGASSAAAPITPARSVAGIVFVIYGTTVPFTADLDLKDFSFFSQGFAIFGHTTGAALGTVAAAGDINQDGINDIFVGGVNTLSKASIVYGQKSVRSSHVDLQTASATSFTFSSALGFALDGGRDFNGDGIPDLLLGDYRAKYIPEDGGSDVTSAGGVWMLPGPFVVPSDAPTANPSVMPIPSAIPSLEPSVVPSAVPSLVPSIEPSAGPSPNPSTEPSQIPTVNPSVNPTLTPSTAPSWKPTIVPSAVPTFVSSLSPTVFPTI